MVTVPDFNPAEDVLLLHVDRAPTIALQASGANTLGLVNAEALVTLQNIRPPALAGTAVWLALAGTAVRAA